MRGTSIKFAITAAIAAAVLAACTVGGTRASSSVTHSPAAMTPSIATTTSTSAVVTVPPVPALSRTSPVTSTSASMTPATSAPALATGDTSVASSSPEPTPVVLPAVTYSTSPKLGSTGISPRTAITLKAAHGTLADIALTGSDGTIVKGTLSTDRATWTLAEPLDYDQTYTLAGRAVSAAGKAVVITGTYGTVHPDDVIHASISPGDAGKVGIGAPILISLGTDILDTAGRQNIERAISVETAPRTPGSFAWIRHDDGWGLDWRPKAYWAPGTKVSVKANLYGVNYGENLWGKADLTSSFTIGRSEITKGDIHTHHLKVYRSGKLVFDFPTSFGLESDPGRVTHGGTYIVMSKEYLHLMSNPAYHYTNFKAYYAVRISNNGTFIHANDGTADVQGYENVTHGCANLTTSNAKAFYDQTMYGDPVEISNSSIPMSQSDGDVYDWSIPWDKWQSMSALSPSYVS
jgi:lipoprotein-anchoring transpeptidase ErfK/SrfK